MSQTLHPDLRRALNEAIIKLGSQARVAEALGADQATVSRWMNSRQGMEVGYCLKFAAISDTPADAVLRWAGYDPFDYLPSAIVLSPEAKEITSRVRMLDWHKRYQQVPEMYRPTVDRLISDLLETFARQRTP